MEPKPIYMSVTTKLVAELIKHIEHGEIRRVRLPNGLGVALVLGEGEQGLLTVSRPATDKVPSENEIKRLHNELHVAFADNGSPVLLFRKLFTEMSVDGRYHVVKFAVYFGEQGRLI